MKIHQAIIDAVGSGLLGALCLFGFIATIYGVYIFWNVMPWAIVGLLILLALCIAWIGILFLLEVREMICHPAQQH